MTRVDPLPLLSSVLPMLLLSASLGALLPLGLSEAGAGLVSSDQLLLRGSDEVRVVTRTPARRIASPMPQPLPAASVVGLGEAEVVARFGHPDGQTAAAPGKVLRYERSGCVLEVYLFPGTSGPALTALDLAGRGECRG